MPDPYFKPRGVRFDWTITAGNVMTLIAGILGAGAAYVDYRVTMDRHEIRITNSEANIVELRQSVAQEQKVQAEATHALDRLTTIIEMQGKERDRQKP